MRVVEEEEEDSMWGLLSGYVESVRALSWLREKRGGRIRRCTLERDMLTGMILWAMFSCSVWREERGCRGCELFFYILVDGVSGVIVESRNEAATSFASLSHHVEHILFTVWWHPR